jgi:class 3 adenylate cyclase
MAAVAQATRDERRHWQADGEVELRGRATHTVIARPVRGGHDGP